MAKTPPKKPKDPAKPTRAKAHRPEAPAHDPGARRTAQSGHRQRPRRHGLGNRHCSRRRTIRSTAARDCRRAAYRAQIHAGGFQGEAAKRLCRARAVRRVRRSAGSIRCWRRNSGSRSTRMPSMPGSQVGSARRKAEGEIDLGRGVTGAAASNAALEKLLREGRAEFQGGIDLDAASPAAAGKARRRHAASRSRASWSRRATSRPRSGNWSKAPTATSARRCCSA